MPRGLNFARRTGTTVPRTQEMRYATGQTFKKGALLVMNTNGEVVEVGADPAAIVGMAGAAVGTGYGYGLPNSGDVTVVTGRAQTVPVLIMDRESEWSIRGVNGGTDPVIPLQTHIGEQYGIAKIGDDYVLDFAEATAKVFEITDIVPEDGNNFFLVKPLQAVLNRP